MGVHRPTRAQLLAALGTVAGTAVGRPVFAQPKAAIRVATLASEAAAEVYYAQELGFFESAGVDVDIQVMQNGAAVGSAVAGNAVDCGWTTPVTLAISKTRNIPFTTIAPAVLYTAQAPFTALFVAKDSPVRTAADLNGKVVAANGLGTMTEFGPRAWIDKNGGDSSKVKFLELPFSTMAGALTAGRVDAAEIGEPALTQAKTQLRRLADPMNAVAAEFLFGVWFTTPTWANAHRDLVAKFVDVIRRTAIWANDPHNAAHSGQLLATFTKIPAPVIARMVRSRYGESLDPKLIQPVVDVAAKYLKFPTFPAAELVYAAR